MITAGTRISLPGRRNVPVWLMGLSCKVMCRETLRGGVYAAVPSGQSRPGTPWGGSEEGAIGRDPAAGLPRRRQAWGSGAALARPRQGPPPAELPIPPATGRSRRDAARRADSTACSAACRTAPAHGKKRGEVERDGYILETWVLDLNGLEPVPAYVARPKALDDGAGRPVQPLARRRLHDRQEGVRRGPQLPAARALREGADRSRATSRSASITGCSASGATRPRRTPSRRCCGRAACCGA